MVFEERAPAKINLALHIRGRNPDGLHEIDSLIAFADCGERVSLSRQSESLLQVTGGFANNLPGDRSNLVLRAASLAGAPDGIGFNLYKNIPVGAGLGGGSADAAAVFRLLYRQFGCAIPSMDAMAELGFDIPVCLFSQSARICGSDHKLSIVGSMPRLPLLLVNPGISLSTAAVYGELDFGVQGQLSPLPGICSQQNLVDWISHHENGLLARAIRVVPEIGDVICRIESLDGCRVARMTGSGATCFGAFLDVREANRAADLLRREQPSWWVRMVVTNGTTRTH